LLSFESITILHLPHWKKQLNAIARKIDVQLEIYLSNVDGDSLESLAQASARAKIEKMLFL
jgi:hypothetical protein